MAKVIISDTSCLIVLSRIGRLHLLNELFGTITITQVVADEFGDPLPTWVEVYQTHHLHLMADLCQTLDPGEASAIALAIETTEPLLIIDELKGRRVARELGIAIIGTIGVIASARKRGLIDDVDEVVRLMSANGFRISKELWESLRGIGNG